MRIYIYVYIYIYIYIYIISQSYRSSYIPLESHSLQLNGNINIIERENFLKFLHVTLDEHLTWKNRYNLLKRRFLKIRVQKILVFFMKQVN